MGTRHPVGRLRGRLLIAATACAAACAGNGAGEATVRTDSAGLAIVTFTGGDLPLAWQFDSLFTLGGADSGPQAFYQLRGGIVGADAAGDLFVLDTDAKRVVVFDSAGTFVRSMGAPGGGPGELQWPIALVVAPDGGAGVFDIGKSGFVRFDADGTVLDQLPMRGRYNGGAIHATGDALVLTSRVWPEGPDDPGREELVRLAGTDTVALISVARPPGRVVELKSCGMSFTGMPPIFTPGLRWAAARDRFAVAALTGYEVMLLHATDTTAIVRRPLEPAAASAEAAAAEIGDRFRVGTSAGVRVCKTAEVVEQVGYAERIPIIAEIAAGPDTTWWVRRRDAAGVDVYAADGSYLGTLPGSAPFPAVALPGHRMASIVTDDLEVERLVIYRVRRSPS